MRAVALAMCAVVACGLGDEASQISRDPKQHLAPSATPSRSLGFRYPGDRSALASAKATIGPANGAAPPTAILGPGPSGTTCGTAVNLGQNAILGGESFCNCIPPDAGLAVGPNHVVVAVNTAMKIYNKAGTLLVGPTNLSTFLAQPGDTLPNFSDPFVLYDGAANRYLVGMINYDTAETTSTINIAVSQTSDPTGAWFLYAYAIQATGNIFDFPHAAINGTNLYVTGNLFANNAFQHARVFAFNLTAMYGGTAGTTVFKDTTTNAVGNPADTLIPAANDTAANVMYFLSADNGGSGGSNISVFRWADPFGANTFALKGGVAVTAYAQPPDPFIGGNQVNMNDARDLAAYYYNGTLYGAHTGGFNSMAGVQWYQIGNLDSTPTLLQQEVLATGTAHRFFPALALDAGGNMMIAYSFAGDGLDFISVTFTARRASDSPGTVYSETLLRAGDGQNATSRWGDYGAMVYDGSQFWHLMEYEGSADPTWSTWLSAMAFTQTPDLDIGVSPQLVTVLDPNPATYTVTTAACNGYSGTVDLSVTNLPSTIASSFSPSSVTVGGSSTLTLTPSIDQPTGTFTFTVDGADHATGTPTAAHDAAIQTQQPCPSIYNLAPSSVTVAETGSGSYTGTIQGFFGWNGTASLSVSGLPANATATLVPSSGGNGTNFTMTVTTNNSPPGFYSAFVLASDGHCASGEISTLQVSAPDFRVTLTPSLVNLKRGGLATYTITVQSLYGFAGSVTLSITGQPTTGTTTTINPVTVNVPLNGSATSTLSIQTTRNTPTGLYGLNVTGTSGSVHELGQAQLQVTR